MSELTDFRVAVLATGGFEESELTEPVIALFSRSAAAAPPRRAQRRRQRPS